MSDQGLWWDDVNVPAGIAGKLFEMRNGRRYIIASTTTFVYPNLVNELRGALTRYIDERPEEDPVFILTETVEQVRRRPPIPFSERARLLAREVVRQLNHKPGVLTFALSPHEPLFCDLMRSCYLDTINELPELFVYWAQRSVITYTLGEDQVAKVQLHVRGLIELEEDVAAADSQTAFVAMWFDQQMTAAYDDAIAPAIEELGYVPVRVDRTEHNNKIDDEIILGIRRARFLVADFSCGEGGARGGVYYEAGFAAGLGKPVIYTVRNADLNRVHFDTRQFNHVVWDNEADLREKLRNRIGASLGEYRK